MTGHAVLYVIPRWGLLKSQSLQRVTLPDIGLRILFETPDSLKDLHRVQGLILCAAIGMDLLDWPTEAAIRTRLHREPHEGCPASTIDYAKCLWL